MRIRIDHTFNAPSLRQRPPAPVEIESLGSSVQLDPSAGSCCGIDDGGNINCITFAFQEQSAGWMRHHCDKGILHRPDYPPRHFGFSQVERRMNGCDDEVELAKDFVRKIKRTVAQDVTLDATENANISNCFV